MTEGNSVVKTKRMGARFFKNPPQPHMCIRDSLKGCSEPCYINVLSWDKVASGVPGELVPLYGGMKVCPPRTEKKEVAVFAVMANPAILKLFGKNTRNPKKQSWLIEMLMDFVEKMNDGVVFSRSYTVLRDRDITGELKEIWMVVQQSERPRTQQIPAEDPRRPVPQYPLYREQHQQQQQQHPMPQHHQHPPQQQQQQQQQQVHNPHEEHVQQPPQYHSSVYYAQESPKNCESYELTCARQNMIILSKDRKYPQYDSASHVDRYIFRDPMVMQNHHPQVPQQNCLNYPAYQYRQMPGMPITGPYPPNIHPNAPLNCPPPHPANPMNLVRPDIPLHYNKMPIDKFYENFHRMQPPQMQPQQPQISLGPPAGYYEPQNQPPPNFRRMLGPQEAQDTARRAPSHLITKPIVIVDPRDTLVAPNPPPPPPENIDALAETPRTHFNASNNVSTGPMTIPVNTSLPRDQNPRKPSTINFLKLFRPQDGENSKKDPNHVSGNENDGNDCQNSHEEESSSVSRNPSNLSKESKKPGKPKIKLLKRHISIGDQKTGICEAKLLLNGETERLQDGKVRDRTSGQDADVENRLEKTLTDCEKNENPDKPRNDATRITKTTTSIRNTLKILTGTGNLGDDAASKKKNNGQVRLQSGRDNGEEVLQVYTILRKPEAATSREEPTIDIAGLSIKERAETSSEVGAVLS